MADMQQQPQQQNSFGSTPGSAFSSIMQGLNGQSGLPFERYGNVFNSLYGQIQNQQRPYQNAGAWAIPRYQNALKNMSDPQAFMKQIMSGYQASPFAQNELLQAQRAGINAASAGGENAPVGSTPYLHEAEDYARSISSQDQQQYFTNATGVNRDFMDGLHNLLQSGQLSATQLSQILAQFAPEEAGSAYGQEAGNQQDKADLWGGVGSLMNMFMQQ